MNTDHPDDLDGPVDLDGLADLAVEVAREAAALRAR